MIKELPFPFCHIWYKNSEVPVVSPVSKYQEDKILRKGHNGNLNPLILGCHPPDSMKHMVPMSVSLVGTKCPRNKPSNNLRVYFEKYESGHKHGIAVCSKWISHLGDLSLRLIEWIELLRAQGVDKIFLHILAVHPNVMKVTAKYQKYMRLKAVSWLLLPSCQALQIGSTKFISPLDFVISFVISPSFCVNNMVSPSYWINKGDVTLSNQGDVTFRLSQSDLEF